MECPNCKHAKHDGNICGVVDNEPRMSGGRFVKGDPCNCQWGLLNEDDDEGGDSMNVTETKIRHTPGPWKLSNPSGGPAYRILGLHFPQGGIDSIVADLMNLEGDPEKFEYDAALIAAAPDMLEALEEAAELVDIMLTGTDVDIFRQRDAAKAWQKSACAAIAKARGGAA